MGRRCGGDGRGEERGVYKGAAVEASAGLSFMKFVGLGNWSRV